MNGLLAEPLAGRGRRAATHRRPRSGDLGSTSWATASSRSRPADAAVATMVVLRDPGEAYLLRHTGGDDAISWVERFDPESLEVIERSPDLAGGPTWPGGVGVHANGSLYVAFGNHVHRLAPDTTLIASRTLPRVRPVQQLRRAARRSPRDQGLRRHAARRNRAVTRTDRAADPRTRAARDRRPARAPGAFDRAPLGRSATTSTSSATTHHCSACIGTARRSRSTTRFQPRYRTIEGQTYGWDAVIDAGAAWFLDNGAGSERYAGTFRGQGISTAPLHLVRVDLATGAVTLAEICGEPNGVVANPPVIDPIVGSRWATTAATA